MIDIAQLTMPNQLTLPAHIAGQFQAADRFLVWAVNDTLYLKRITPPAITERVAQAPLEEQLSLEEINDLVHQVRRERKGV